MATYKHNDQGQPFADLGNGAFVSHAGTSLVFTAGSPDPLKASATIEIMPAGIFALGDFITALAQASMARGSALIQ